MSNPIVPNYGVLASGGGTSCEALVEQIRDPNLDVHGTISLVVSDKPDAGILERVSRWREDYGFETATEVINGQSHPEGKQGRGQTDQESRAIADLMMKHGVTHVLLLGYMRIVRGPLLDIYGFHPGNRDESIFDANMINIHPGLIPETADTHGEGASERMLELHAAGQITEAGHATHVVSATIDDVRGLIKQTPVPIKPGATKESLNADIQISEKRELGPTLQDFVIQQAAYLEWRIGRLGY